MSIPKQIFENDFEIRRLTLPYGEGYVIDGLEVLPKEYQEEILKETVKRYNLHTELLDALKPLANLDLTGVTGEIVYQRNDTVITKSDILKALEAIKKATE